MGGPRAGVSHTAEGFPENILQSFKAVPYTAVICRALGHVVGTAERARPPNPQA